MRLTFSEHVNQGAFAQAFSIVPPLDGPLRFRWRKRSVSIRLPAALRDSTTYVITLDDRLRDARGVRLTRPVTLAFATGDRIDQGRLRGQVFEPKLGMPVPSVDVFAFAAPYSPDAEPLYRTQTSETGRFEFSYLRELDYFVLVLRDINRNRRADVGEGFATPPAVTMRARPDTTEDWARWFYTRTDTLAPELSRVRALSSFRLVAHFSEAITMDRPNAASWSVADSVSDQAVRVRAVYTLSSDPYTVYLQTDSLYEQTYQVVADPMLSDSSGNRISPAPAYVTARPRADTLRTRFVRFEPGDSSPQVLLAPDARPGVSFNLGVPDSLLRALIEVQDTLGTPVSYEPSTANGTTWDLILDPARPDVLEVLVAMPDSTYTRRFRWLSDRDLGSVAGVSWPVHNGNIIELLDQHGIRTARVAASENGLFELPDLPEGEYTLRAFTDLNGNGKWDGGTVYPWFPAEPVVWGQESVQVRPRWETALPDTLHIR